MCSLDTLVDITYECFFRDYLMKNKPCIFSDLQTQNWESRKKWVSSCGKPNYYYLEQNFGSAVVPVADCNIQEYNSQRKFNMPMKDFLIYWQTLKDNDTDKAPCWYLKDWHFCRNFPDYKAYTIPQYMVSDWLNEYCEDEEDDYRFVYMGPKGTWTPLHMDVFGSYSWSANICGRKKWILFPPGIDKSLCDCDGKLIYDVEKLKELNITFPKNFEIVQEPGEIIFIPSGWYHQVWNLDDCISINHNWFNACNIAYIYKCIAIEAVNVANEVSDCKVSEDWDEIWQNLLKVHHGMNYCDFCNILYKIGIARFNKFPKDWQTKFDIIQIIKALSLILEESNVPKFIHEKTQELQIKLNECVSSFECDSVFTNYEFVLYCA